MNFSDLKNKYKVDSFDYNLLRILENMSDMYLDKVEEFKEIVNELKQAEEENREYTGVRTLEFGASSRCFSEFLDSIKRNKGITITKLNEESEKEIEYIVRNLHFDEFESQAGVRNDIIKSIKKYLKQIDDDYINKIRNVDDEKKIYMDIIHEFEIIDVIQ